MTIETSTIVSVTEANQNFSRVTRIAEKNGQAVIFKNNRPKYLLIDLDTSPVIDLTDDERIDILTFLEVNGIRMDCTNDDVVRTGLGVAAGEMGYEELLAWVRKHKK